MTPEEIDQLPAGHELDALIAEKVMGFEVNRNSPYWIHRLGRYSTEIEEAWLVVEAIRGKVGRRRNLFFRIPSQTGLDIWAADSADMKNEIMLASAQSVPLAICRAALKTVIGVKE